MLARVRGPLEPCAVATCSETAPGPVGGSAPGRAQRSEYVDGLRGELERLGYMPLSAAGHVRLVAHLSRWMIQGGLSILGVDTGNGGRVLRPATGGRLLQLAHGPVVAVAAGLPARTGGLVQAGAGDCDDSL